MRGKRFVIFDIDGTLVRAPGTERRFYRYLLRHGAQGPRQIFAFAGALLAGIPRYRRQVLKKNKAYLAGLSVSRVQRLARAWVDVELPRCSYAPALERLRHHQRAGDRIMLLSGTPDFLATAIAAKLGVADSAGSTVPTRDGQYVAGALLRHPFGLEKRRLAESFVLEYGVQRADILAYADSVHDVPLLEWAGEAVVVQPDTGLLQVARSRGWPLLGTEDGH